MQRFMIFMLIAGLFGGTIASQAADFNASNLNKLQFESKPKSHFWGALYSVIPGVAVHGAGHLYTEEYGKAALLLGTEFLSIMMMAIGWADEDFSIAGVPPPGLPPVDGLIENDNDHLIGLLGATLFVASWLYDIIDTQHSIGKHNEIIRCYKPDLSLKLQDSKGNEGLFMGLTWRF